MKAKICEIYVTTVVHEVGGVLMALSMDSNGGNESK